MRFPFFTTLSKTSATFLFLVVALSASAQTPQPNQPRTAQTPTAQERDGDNVVIATRRVNLPITVLDKKDQPVTGLTKNDFQVLEDKTPQAIESFAIESNNQPLYVGVLMDTSSSTAGKLRFQQEAIMNFIYAVSRIRKDQVAFGTFDNDIELKQDFTTRLDLLDKAVNIKHTPGTNTALYDAIYEFCDQKMRGVRGLRALVIVTDGDDTYSRATMRDAIEIAQATETTIFAISTKAGISASVVGVEAGTVKDSGDKILEKLCEETGGRAFFTGDILALERSFLKIANQLRAQYIVTYRPTNERYDGARRKIEVKLANKKGGYKIRTREGYVASVDALRQ